MDAYGNAVIDERIRYEVDEQTRGLLHHSKATHATIRKCVSRTIGKKLQQEASEVSNHSSIQPRRSVNSNMGENNNNDNEENFNNSNNDLDANNSAIAVKMPNNAVGAKLDSIKIEKPIAIVNAV